MSDSESQSDGSAEISDMDGDVEKFMKDRETLQHNNSSESEAESDEVVGLDVESSSDDDEDEYVEVQESDSDGEGETDEDAITPFGAHRTDLYDGEDYGDDSIANEEEEEARRLQKLMQNQLSDEDFGLNGTTKQSTKKSKKSKKESKKDLKTDKKKSSGSAVGANNSLFARELAAVSVGDEDTVESTMEVEKDLDGMDDAQKLARVRADAPELIKLLKQLQDGLQEIREAQMEPLLKKVKNNELPTQNGVSHLELKYHVLMTYCTNIVFYLLLKARGRPVKDHPVFNHLFELRTVLEKLRPLDQKLKYHIEKLLAVKGEGAEEEDLQANPDALQANIEEADELGDDSIYHNPRMSAAVFGNTDGAKAKEDKELERLRKKASRSRVFRELRNEVSDKPEFDFSIGAGGAMMTDADRRRAAYEEETFSRLTVTKKDKKAAKRQRQRMVDELNAVDDFGDLDEFIKSSSKGNAEDEDYLKRKRLQQALQRAKLAQPKKGNAVSGDQDLPRLDGRKRGAAKSASHVLDVEDHFGGGAGNSRKQKRGRGGGDDNLSGEDEMYVAAVESKRRKLAEKQSRRPEVHYAADEAEDRRGASKNILTNRGLTPARSKDVSNPRKKHRKRFEKAVTKRRSMTRGGGGQAGPYAGESTGIKTNVVRSVKLG